MNNISEHISYAEAIKSEAAIRKGLSNEPGVKELEAMQLIAEKVFEPLRQYISLKRGKDTPIKINSFFRSEEVNRAIGGSSTSQHCKGEAMDLECNYPDFNNRDLFHMIKERGAWDQLIWEFGNESEPAWVHVSFTKGGNRKQVLRAISENGKTKYIPFK